MFGQKQGAGTRFNFPLETRLKIPGSVMSEMVSPVWFSHLGVYWYYEDFLWDAFDATEHPLAIYDASSGGTPTTDLVADGTGGQFQIQIASDSEAELVGFHMAGNLYIQGNKPFIFATRLKVVHTMAANEILVWGLASDIDTSTLDNLTRNLWFRVETDTDLMLESDDATTDTDDKDTGIDLTADTFYWFVIEHGFDGKYYFRVAEGDGDNVKTFNLENKFGVTAPSFGANNMQPVILAQKTSGTTQPEIKIDVIAFAGVR